MSDYMNQVKIYYNKGEFTPYKVIEDKDGLLLTQSLDGEKEIRVTRQSWDDSYLPTFKQVNNSDIKSNHERHSYLNFITGLSNTLIKISWEKDCENFPELYSGNAPRISTAEVAAVIDAVENFKEIEK